MSDPAPRIVLTGASGFVGRQVLRNLPRGADIHAVSRRRIETLSSAVWHEADLLEASTCADLMAEVRPDILIHCAWTTGHGTFWHDPENALWLEAGKALFDAFVNCGGRRVVACGTCAEYAGDRAAPRREDEVIDPSTIPLPYGRAKLALLNHLRTLDVSHAWARIFLAYGEGEDPRRLVPSVLSAISRGEPANCSSGTQLRDFLDVRDLGAAISRLATSHIQGIINLGSGQHVTIGEVVKKLGELAGRPDLIRLGALPDRKGEQPVLVPDISRQINALGFQPAISLDQGLSDATQLWLAEYQP